LAVVITGGAAMLQKIQHNYETEQKSKAQLIAYQFEIGTRIQNMRYFLTQAKTVGDAKLALASVFQSKFPLNPELEKQSLSALFFNLHQLIKGSEKEKTKRAMEVVLKLE
jgi:actin-related protein